MPRLRPPRPHRPQRPHRPARRPPSGTARIVVLGDLMVDVVLAPSRPLERRARTSPAMSRSSRAGRRRTTARWLGRLGARSSLISAVGRDAAGRALVATLRADHVTPRVTRVAGARTGRIGVLVSPDGERSFVADRGAADLLRPDDLQAGLVHRRRCVAHARLFAPGRAARVSRPTGRRAGARRRGDGQHRSGLDRPAPRGSAVAPHAPLLADIAPDLIFATATEAEALLGRQAVEGCSSSRPMAVVKRGPKGATVLARDRDRPLRFEVATVQIAAADTTGAGDAFDAGFLVGLVRGPSRRVDSLPASLQRAALAGHRAAAAAALDGARRNWRSAERRTLARDAHRPTRHRPGGRRRPRGRSARRGARIHAHLATACRTPRTSRWRGLRGRGPGRRRDPGHGRDP